MAKKANDFKTAKIYAQALYDSAQSAGVLQDVMKDIKSLQDAELTKIKEVSCFTSPIVELKVKNDIIAVICKKLGLCEQTQNLLKILIENGQFKILEPVMKDFIDLYNKDHNIAEVTVETVKELSKTQN